MRSIQSKLNSGLVLSLIVVFSALWLLVSISIELMTKDYVATRLKHDAEMLLTTIKFDDVGVLSIDTTHVDLIYNQPFSGHYYVISTDEQLLGSRSLWDYELRHVTVDTGKVFRSSQAGPEQQSLLLVTVGYNKQGNDLSITIAEDLNPVNKNIKQFKYWFAAMALGMLFALVVIQAVILRKSLKPLARMHTELKLLQQGKQKKLSADAPLELKPLIDEVNHLLAIMEHRLRRSRDALSDLAHAIKKPLTVIKQITDKDDLSDSVKHTLIKQTDDIYQISDHILKRARLAGHGHAGSLFSFADDLPLLLKTLDMMYANKIIKLDVRIKGDVFCPIDREDMLELLGNLMDNAYIWAAHKIMLSVSVDSSLHIYIEDDGPGADPEKIGEISKRGVRLDERVQGHGFGLAISVDMVNDYSGNIKFTKSERLGGFKVEIILPLHQEQSTIE